MKEEDLSIFKYMPLLSMVKFAHQLNLFVWIV